MGIMSRLNYRQAIAALSAILLSATALTAATPSQANAADLNGKVQIVSNDSFAPAGYDWHFNFTGVKPERGFIASDDISQYFTSNSIGDLAKVGDKGLAAIIDGNTSVKDANGNYRFALRYTGGTYTDANGTSHGVDAIVTITDWKFKEWPEGFTKDPYIVSYPPKNPKAGIFVNANYSPNNSERRQVGLSSLTNFNFFTISLTDVNVNVKFVEAGTTKTLGVKGHMTCIDLDIMQQFSFSGAIDGVEIAQSSQENSNVGSGRKWIEISDDGKTVTGTGDIRADAANPNYQKGLVGVYFSTGGSKSDSFNLHFRTSLGRIDDWVTISFFAMTSEYVANPAKFNMALEKQVDPQESNLEDIITYQLSTTLPKEGVDVRLGYRIPSFTIRDVLEPQLRYADYAQVLVGGTALSQNNYTVSTNGNAITVSLNASYLGGLKLDGQKLTVKLLAKIVDYPEPNAQGEYVIPNKGALSVGNDNNIPSNTVYVKIKEPPLKMTHITVAKKIKADQVYWKDGSPSFMIKVSGSDKKGNPHSYATMLSFEQGMKADSAGYLNANYTFQNVPEGIYTVTESKTARYSFEKLETNGKASGQSSQLNTSELENPFATFINTVNGYDDGSDAVAVTNHIKAN